MNENCDFHLEIRTRLLRYLLGAVVCLMGTGTFDEVFALDRVGKYQVYEIAFVTETVVANPFDTYLLKVELESPSGRKSVIDGFFDGDGRGGQDGRVWKARICPDEVGTWRWKTVPGDKADAGLIGQRGHFECVESEDPGGIVRDGKYFRFQEGGHIFLQGNFLDFSTDLPSTHVYMSEMITDQERSAILARQRDFHKSNKINVYFANTGDYGGLATTPWVKSASGHDRSRMDIPRWTKFDQYLQDFKKAGMFAEMWFFADDSGFGGIPQPDKNRLFRYGMARTSAFNHTLYVIALEWQEGWSKSSVKESGQTIQSLNPWGRMISVHSLPGFEHEENPVRRLIGYLTRRDWEFPGESWASFIASQAGNDAGPAKVNAMAVRIHEAEDLPHLSEEFGILKQGNADELRKRMWANFLGGAAGGGTGSHINALMKFIEVTQIPFFRMKPSNNLSASGGKAVFCASDSGHHYLVYSMGADFDLKVEGKNLMGQWYDPSEGTFSQPFRVESGKHAFTIPQKEKDWILWVTQSEKE